MTGSHSLLQSADGNWYWPSTVVLFFALLYVVLPYGATASLIYVLITAYAAGAIALPLWRRTGIFRPTAWGLVSGAVGLAAIGHGIWYGLDLAGLEPFPSPADIFYLAVYPLFMIGLWQLGRDGKPGEGAFSDALMVGISAAVLGWALLIAPYIYDPELSLLQLLIATAYPVADLLLIPLLLRLVFLNGTRIKAHLLLLLGVLAYLTADLLYAHGTSTGWYEAGGLTDALWLVAYALFVAAVRHPSARVKPPARVSRLDLSRHRLWVLGGASVVVPALILMTAGTDLEIVRISAIASIALFLLVLYRMAGLLNETHRQADELERLSLTDPLTGAANRRYLEQVLEREMARARRSEQPLCLALMDLDHFKQYNDSHGHLAGDRLLQELIRNWQTALRQTDMVARVGGEEFVVLFPDMDIDAGKAVLERLKTQVPDNQSCSCGLTCYRPGDTAVALTDRADKALYLAKDRGRDQVVVDPG